MGFNGTEHVEGATLNERAGGLLLLRHMLAQKNFCHSCKGRLTNVSQR